VKISRDFSEQLLRLDLLRVAAIASQTDQSMQLARAQPQLLFCITPADSSPDSVLYSMSLGKPPISGAN
jgi:hypothetical protein